MASVVAALQQTAAAAVADASSGDVAVQAVMIAMPFGVACGVVTAAVAVHVVHVVAVEEWELTELAALVELVAAVACVEFANVAALVVVCETGHAGAAVVVVRLAVAALPVTDAGLHAVAVM